MSIQKLRSVLYVDDDPDICAVVRATLRMRGDLNVHLASSGEQAIALATEQRPDLILMDVMMPVLDGTSTFKRMQERAETAEIPVIFLTAKVLPVEVAQFLKLGAIGVIGKPFDPMRLCGDLLALWNGSRGARADPPGVVAGLEGSSPQDVSLTESFLARARNDVVLLRGILETIRAGDLSRLQELERVAHSLHGAAAMFGFPKVSAFGASIESLAERVIARRSSFKPVILEQLADRTDQLARELASLAPRISPGFMRAGHVPEPTPR